MSTISSNAATAREQARRTDGRFGEQHKTDPGQLDLGRTLKGHRRPIHNVTAAYNDMVRELTGGRQDAVDFRSFAVELVGRVNAETPEGIKWVFREAGTSALADRSFSDDEVKGILADALATIDFDDMVERHRKDRPQPAAAPPEGLDTRFKEWYDQATAAGWESVPGGPWGEQVPGGPIDPTTGQQVTSGERRPGDRSVLLRKDDMVVWLVDRDMVGTDRKERWTASWFDHGKRAFTLPDTFDEAKIERQRGTCLKCKTHVGANQLQRVGFAGAYCNQCAPRERERQEFPGWNN